MQSRRIEINLAAQRLDLLENGRAIFSAPISSAQLGTGNEADSFQTPTGAFVIAEKIGANAPLDTVFRSRVATGERADPENAEDQIVSRILWLDGVEEGNRNTKSRYIYLHGTNHEADLGNPCSHGCIRLGQREIVDLFDQVREGTPVWIG